MKMIDPQKQVLARWNPSIKAKASDEATINIYDQIGVDFWTGEGMTAKIVSSILRKADGSDVVVNINSPGGDFFEGLAIYNMLKDYEGNVDVRIVGMAASAASVIALAGNNVKVAQGAFLMIHNAWTFLAGNKEQMRESADVLEQFDASMVGIYTDNSNLDEQEIKDMMAAETWINGKDAIEMGFASAPMDEEIEQEEQVNSSLKKIDIALAKAGMPRTERRALIKDLTGTPSATEPTPSAGLDEELSKLLETLKS